MGPKSRVGSIPTSGSERRDYDLATSTTQIEIADLGSVGVEEVDFAPIENGLLVGI